MPELFDTHLIKAFKKDKILLENTKIPIITVSGAYREDVKQAHGLPADNTTPDIVFSRAHFSMALGTAMQAWNLKSNPKSAWIVDPTNYVSSSEWHTITFTERIGKLLARQPFLKLLKDFVDTFGRQKLPILKSITPPLLYLTEHISYPILSFHIASGNILAEQGKTLVQVVTDPHVRDEYVLHSDKPNIYFCVFDEQTKTEFLEKSALHGKNIDSDRVIVTGPPIDPRIISARNAKIPWRNGILNLCITTGGLGTNSKEIHSVLEQILPQLHKKNLPIRIIVYAGTQHDIYQATKALAKKHRVAVGKPTDKTARLRILYHPQIFDANELLIKFAFPWADGFITKPSGDMAYDAAASGAFILTLAEWGEWEEKIREVFEQRDIARTAITENIITQLEVLSSAQGKAQSWIEKAMLNAQRIDPLFLSGAKNILKVVSKVAQTKAKKSIL